KFILKPICENMKKFFKKHKFLLLTIFIFLFFMRDILLVNVVTPIRCEAWKGKEMETILTPNDWRILSRVDESLKGTKWVHYNTVYGEPEKDLFFIKNKDNYQPRMDFNSTMHSLISVNEKYPNLNLYYYVNPRTILGHDTFILYDQKLKRRILQYNLISGYYRLPFFGTINQVKCDDLGQDYFDLIESYLN
ncbi:hypothetical protein ACWIUA_12440, partial [Ursidibacter sp. B-7004-1]